MSDPASFSKVPQITLYFWIVKVTAVSVGQGAADLLDRALGLGAAAEFAVFGALLIAALIWQVSLDRYHPPVFWLTMFLAGIAVTLAVDLLARHVALALLGVAGLSALAAAIGALRLPGGALTFRSVVPVRRELCFWSAILATFVLGRVLGLSLDRAGASSDAMLVYTSLAAALLAILRFRVALGNALVFWAACVLTRPLGASLAAVVAGTGHASTLAAELAAQAVFAVLMLGTIVYLTVSHVDLARTAPDPG